MLQRQIKQMRNEKESKLKVQRLNVTRQLENLKESSKKQKLKEKNLRKITMTQFNKEILSVLN